MTASFSIKIYINLPYLCKLVEKNLALFLLLK